MSHVSSLFTNADQKGTKKLARDVFHIFATQSAVLVLLIYIYIYIYIYRLLAEHKFAAVQVVISRLLNVEQDQK